MPSPIIEIQSEIRERRRRRAAEIVSESFFSLPRHISQLASLLSSPPVDLARVSRIILGDSEFSELLFSLASTELFNAQACDVTIPQAVVLLGSECLRALALGYAFMKSAGECLTHGERHSFWRHSFLAAMLSERSARQAGQYESGHAYLGGLLHDIGHLVLLNVAREEDAFRAVPSTRDWHDNPADERRHFGTDHCEVGRSIAMIWNLPDGLIDMIEHHHSPSRAKDSKVAEIVASGDHYASLLFPYPAKARGESSVQKANAVMALIEICVPPLFEERSHALVNSLTDDRAIEPKIAAFVH